MVYLMIIFGRSDVILYGYDIEVFRELSGGSADKSAYFADLWRWFSGVMVRASDLWSTGRDSRVRLPAMSYRVKPKVHHFDLLYCNLQLIFVAVCGYSQREREREREREFAVEAFWWLNLLLLLSPSLSSDETKTEWTLLLRRDWRTSESVPSPSVW